MKFTQSRDGFRDLRNSVGVQEDLLRRAERVRDAAGAGYSPQGWERNPGFVADVGPGKTRARAGVVTANPHSANVNARDNTLLRALEAARD